MGGVMRSIDTTGGHMRERRVPVFGHFRLFRARRWAWIEPGPFAARLDLPEPEINDSTVSAMVSVQVGHREFQVELMTMDGVG